MSCHHRQSLLDNAVKISATISGPKSFHGQNGLKMVENGAIIVTFYRTSDKNTNGTNTSWGGQFYEIFISDAES